MCHACRSSCWRADRQSNARCCRRLQHGFSCYIARITKALCAKQGGSQSWRLHRLAPAPPPFRCDEPIMQESLGFARLCSASASHSPKAPSTHRAIAQASTLSSSRRWVFTRASDQGRTARLGPCCGFREARGVGCATCKAPSRPLASFPARPLALLSACRLHVGGGGMD